jgi:hypothetical protein
MAGRPGSNVSVGLPRSLYSLWFPNSRTFSVKKSRRWFRTCHKLLRQAVAAGRPRAGTQTHTTQTACAGGVAKVGPSMSLQVQAEQVLAEQVRAEQVQAELLVLQQHSL